MRLRNGADHCICWNAILVVQKCCINGSKTPLGVWVSLHTNTAMPLAAIFCKRAADTVIWSDSKTTIDRLSNGSEIESPAAKSTAHWPCLRDKCACWLKCKICHPILAPKTFIFADNAYIFFFFDQMFSAKNIYLVFFNKF